MECADKLFPLQFSSGVFILRKEKAHFFVITRGEPKKQADQVGHISLQSVEHENERSRRNSLN